MKCLDLLSQASIQTQLGCFQLVKVLCKLKSNMQMAVVITHISKINIQTLLLTAWLFKTWPLLFHYCLPEETPPSGCIHSIILKTWHLGVPIWGQKPMNLWIKMRRGCWERFPEDASHCKGTTFPVPRLPQPPLLTDWHRSPIAALSRWIYAWP